LFSPFSPTARFVLKHSQVIFCLDLTNPDILIIVCIIKITVWKCISTRIP
jgi:uncharacterized membrane protein YpjA